MTRWLVWFKRRGRWIGVDEPDAFEYHERGFRVQCFGDCPKSWSNDQ